MPRYSLAATGDLTAAGCISKEALAGCNTNGGGALEEASGVAVSPDGTSVYVASYFDNSISVFNRAARPEFYFLRASIRSRGFPSARAG